MSMFASRTQKTIEIPFEPGQTAVIQKLSGRHLDKASTERLIRNQNVITRLGGSEYRRQIADAQRELEALAAKSDGGPESPAAAPPPAQADPLTSYDVDTLLMRGIKSWTLPESLDAELVDDEERPGSKVLRIKALDDLDSEAREFFAREILRLSKPSLFQTEAEREAAQGEGSSPSTTS